MDDQAVDHPQSGRGGTHGAQRTAQTGVHGVQIVPSLNQLLSGPHKIDDLVMGHQTLDQDGPGIQFTAVGGHLPNSVHQGVHE